MNYYLMKSEPDCFSIDDLKKLKKSNWDGVRNYQARNFMMQMKKRDKILFYHSSAKEIGVAGIAEVSKEHFPDHTSWDPKNEHFDSRIKNGDPRWQMVEVKFVKKFPKIITLEKIKQTKELKNMSILQRGSRLSVTPVTAKEFEKILTLL